MLNRAFGKPAETTDVNLTMKDDGILARLAAGCARVARDGGRQGE
jgi:hypothetical protein